MPDCAQSESEVLAHYLAVLEEDGLDVAAARLEGGEDNDVVICPEFVARFPGRSEFLAGATARVQLLQALALVRLPANIPCIIVAHCDRELGHAYVATTLVTGDPTDRLTCSDFTLTSVGLFLDVLHSEAVASRVPASRMDWRLRAMRAREVAPSVLPDEVLGPVAPLLEACTQLPSVEPRLVHGDFGGGHLLWDRSGRLSGVIDWDNACLTDPAFDAFRLWDPFGVELVVELAGAEAAHRGALHYLATLVLCAFIGNSQRNWEFREWSIQTLIAVVNVASRLM